jgi:hypothetical protein
MNEGAKGIRICVFLCCGLLDMARSRSKVGALGAKTKRKRGG